MRYNPRQITGGEMSGKRTRYSATEKAKIALEAIKGEKTVAEIVAKYSVHATQVNQWKGKR